MREDIRLFINGQEVEFSIGPKINYNYKLTDFTNPTIVRNNYSKSVEIPGTERNNDIFGHIWDLERVQHDAAGGAGFNPLKKTPFELYVGGALKEKGYCKLTNVKKKKGNITYSLQLYGGLGSFLYNLAYDESQNDERHRTLADLKYNYDTDGVHDEPELDFKINKNTVLQAWNTYAGIRPIGTYIPIADDKWNTINFAPCYNGLPDDFDANKVLINHTGIANSVLNRAYGSGTLTGYHTVLNGVAMTNDTTGKTGYSLGEAGEDMTEWETKDLRSYLQRPVLRVYRTILACKDPSINGGYDFQLSEKFFNKSKNGFYYGDAWMTLPMLKDLEIEGGQTEQITGATMSSGSSVNTTWNVNFTTPGGLAQVNGARLVIEPRLVVESGESQPDELHFSRYWYSNSNCINPKTLKKYYCENVYIVQLIARNADREIVSQSKAYYFSEAQKFPNGASVTKYFWQEGDEGTQPEYVWRKGYFKKINGEYRFVASDSQQTWSVAFDIPAGQEITFLEFKTMTAIGMGYEAKWDVIPTIKVDPVTATTDAYLYNTLKRTGGGCYEAEDVVDAGLSKARIVLNLNSFEGTGIDYESMFSDTTITKEKLLSTPFSPADFLLSYAKMFGFYLYYDPTEISNNPDLYPNGVIHLLDRTEYYQMYDNGPYKDPVVENLDKMIDRSKDMNIVPAVASAKFYKFEQEPVESEGNKNYFDTYGHNYGRQLVNTGYNFDNSVNDLYEGNVFKSALMCLEKDKYFKPQNSNGLQPFVNSTYKYYVYRTGLTETHEFSVAYSNYSGRISPNSALTGYDLFPKMQFHEANNEASDGAYVLCSWVGNAACQTGGAYILTDDVADMVYLNGATPCWIMSPNDSDGDGVRIAWKLGTIPIFSRDLWSNTDTRDGMVVNTWNFGHPKEILCPFTYSTEGDCIYDKYWKKYIGDLYSVDDRKLTCYVNLPDNPFPGAMRQFYWFDNGIWRLNEVKDWNVFGFDSTLCEFVKVQSTDNYKTPLPSDAGVIEMFVSPSILPHAGGNVTITIKNQTGQDLLSDGDFQITGLGSAGGTYSIDTPYTHEESISGTYITFTVYVPMYYTSEEILWTFEVIDGSDIIHTVNFKQLGGSVTIVGEIPDWNYWETDARSVSVHAVPAGLGYTVRKADPGYHFDLDDYQNTLTIFPYNENTSEVDREATITVSNGNDSASFVVRQKGYPTEPYINVYLPAAWLPDLLALSSIAQDKYQHVDTNVSWTVTAFGGNWLTAEKVDNGTVKVSVTVNNTGNQRWGSVTLTDGHISKTFSVSQSG